MTDSIETSEDEAMPWVPPVATVDTNAMDKTLPPLPEELKKWMEWFTEDAQSELTQIIQAYALAAIEAQGVPDGWNPTDDELTAIYKKANGEDTGKAQPLTTQRIFKAMRAMLASAPPAPQAEDKGRAYNLINHQDTAQASLLRLLKQDHPAPQAEPIDMVLHCPACGMQHIDAPEEHSDVLPRNHGHWTNPPHRSHLCHGCGHIWRPADVPTNGVTAVKTKGKADSPLAAPQAEACQKCGLGPVPDGFGCAWCGKEAQQAERTALEQYDLEQSPEYRKGWDDGRRKGYEVGVRHGKEQHLFSQAAVVQQEPVMIYHGDCTIDCGEHGHHNVELLKMIPAGSLLYTHPAQQAKQPLSDEQIEDFRAAACTKTYITRDDYHRAFRDGWCAAHGIKGE